MIVKQGPHFSPTIPEVCVCCQTFSNTSVSHLSQVTQDLLSYHSQLTIYVCNAPHLVECRNSKTPDTIDINRENTIISFEADVGKTSS
jgi:hypothetical protein